MVKVRDGQVANRPIYAAIGVTLAGEKDVLGLWAGTGGEGAKFWMSVLTDLRNRGVKDTFFVVCDGLKGLPEVVGNVWPQATVQTCVIHLLRNTGVAELDDGHDVQGPVDPPVAGAGEPVAFLVAGGGVQRCGAVPGGEPVPVGEAADVADVGEQPGGAGGADAGAGPSGWSRGR